MHISYHNLCVQVYGTTRWVLFPPSESNHLYVFPFLHPSMSLLLHTSLICSPLTDTL